MSKINRMVWPVAIPAAAALSMFGVVATSSVASAVEPVPGVAADSAERPDPATVPYFGVHPRITRDGVYVRAVVPGGPGDVAGLQSGDKIVSVNGVSLDHRGAFREAIDGVVPGDVVSVVYERDGVETTVRVTAGSQADRPGPEDRPWFGAMPERPQERPGAGVVIGDVSAGSPADTAGLQVGDVVTSVNGVDASNPRAAFGAMNELAPGATVVLEVTRGGSPVTVVVVLGSQADNPNREQEMKARQDQRQDQRQERRDQRQERRDERRAGQDGGPGFGARGSGSGAAA